jgi:hypothetical protein
MGSPPSSEVRAWCFDFDVIAVVRDRTQAAGEKIDWLV